MTTTLFTIGNDVTSEFSSIIQLPEIPGLYEATETDTRDITIHNWLVENWSESCFQQADNPILVLTASNINFRIGAHIRLTYFEKKDWACLPIVYVYPGSDVKNIMENWYTKFGSLSSIIGTQGVYLYALEDVLALVNDSESEDDLFADTSSGHIILDPLSCDDTTFKLGFLNKLSLPPNDVIGHHALGNIWGAYVLDSILNINALHQNETYKKERCKLYFKLMAARHQASIQGITVELKELPKISLGERKIAIIDDEAHKGFADVIRAYFGNPDPDKLFVINEKVASYDELSDDAKKIIEDEEIHLFLLDLRLNGSDEEEHTNTRNYSGATVLQKIKSLNKANQVIMFTASNKAWNMRALFDMGADDYYIKESAEGGFNWEESRSNALKLLSGFNSCFNKDYLWNIYQCHRDIEDTLAIAPFGQEKRSTSFYENTRSNLETAFDLLRISRNDDQYMNYAYLAYFRIVEEFVVASGLISKKQNRFNVTCRDGSSLEVFNKDTKESALSYIRDSNFNYGGRNLHSPHFRIEASSDGQIPQTLANISYILAFRYESDDKELKRWGELNAIRNQIVVHGNTKVGHLNVGKAEIERISNLLLTLLEEY